MDHLMLTDSLDEPDFNLIYENTDSETSENLAESGATENVSELETAGPLLEWQYRRQNLAVSTNPVITAPVIAISNSASVVTVPNRIQIAQVVSLFVEHPILRSIENSMLIDNSNGALLEWRYRRQVVIPAAEAHAPHQNVFSMNALREAIIEIEIQMVSRNNGNDENPPKRKRLM